MGMPTFAIKRPVMTAMIFLGLILLGLIALVRLPVELYQGQNQGIISIIVRARGGLAPVEVEKTITIPIEESIATVSRIKNLYSHSREAESRVTMEFETGTDMRFAALEVREKFSRVQPLLPKQIEKPVIANYDDAESAIFIFAISSEMLNPEQIRELVEQELKPILSRVDGVASLEVYGGRERKILVELDRDKMMDYNVSVERVMDILGQSNVNLLAGNVDRGTLELAVRTMGAFESVDEIGEIGIKASRQGTIIPLKEIATVKDSYLEAQDIARLNLEQNVSVYVKKTSTANTIPVVKTVRLVLDKFKEAHAGQFDIIAIKDKAQTISNAISDVWFSLFIGMILTVIIIFLFFRKWILAAIILLSIPCSLISTFFFMNFLGISINVMTLSGLALAIGILVDSAIVIIENVVAKKEDGAPDDEAILKGAEEMWAPLFASLFMMLVVFLPIIFIDKKIQITYAGFAFTVCSSLTASFFVAQLLVPMLTQQWGKGQLTGSENPDPFIIRIQNWGRRLMEWMRLNFKYVYVVLAFVRGLFSLGNIKNFYRRIMKWNFKYPYVVIVIVSLFFAASFIYLLKQDIDQPASFEENEFSIVVFPLAGAKLESNDDAIKKVEEMLGKIPDVDMFNSTVRKDDIRIDVRLKPKRKRQFSKDEIIKTLDEKGNEMIKQVHDDYSLIVDEGVGSSESKKLIVNIFGHDNDVLQKLAIEGANQMAKIPGLQNLVMTDLRKRPEYSLIVDKGRAALFGLTIKKVADSIHAQVRGMRPTKFHELSKGEEIETITRLQAIYRQKLDDLKMIPVETDSGKQIHLGEISNFYPTTGPQTIDRKDKYRYVFVKGDAKRPMETLAKQVSAVLRSMKFPDEYYWRFGENYEELMQSKGELTLSFILTIFLVYMVLACLFQSYVQPLLVMVSILFALIGVACALKITGTPLSQQVFIGGTLLVGSVGSPAVILVDRVNHLKSRITNREDLIIQGGLDRLRPILMTAVATSLGFLPLALGFSSSSALWAPLAITVIGGLISSTLLTLLVLPTLLFVSDNLKQGIRNLGTGIRYHIFHSNQFK